MFILRKPQNNVPQNKILTSNNLIFREISQKIYYEWVSQNNVICSSYPKSL